VLVSGENFSEEMEAFARTAADRDLALTFVDGKHLPHDWNAGWVLQGLSAAQC
jgi:hypothetical protein